MENEPGFVYLMFSPETGRGYVGSTNNPVRRRREHLSALRSGRHHNPRLQKEFDASGNLEFLVVETNDREEALFVESELIEQHWKDPALLNTARDVLCPNIGVEVSQVTREKHRQFQLGKVMSAESRENNRQAKLAAWQDPVYREKQKIARMNKVLTEEHKQNLLRTSFFVKQAVKVEVGGTPYKSVKEAAKAHGVPYTTASKRFLSQNFKDWIRTSPPQNPKEE